MARASHSDYVRAALAAPMVCAAGGEPEPAQRRAFLAERIAENTAAWWAQRADAAADIAALSRAKAAAGGGPFDGDTRDGELCRLADLRAECVLDRIGALGRPVTWEWLDAECKALGIEGAHPLKDCTADALRGAIKRATCPHWWRRRLRRVAARMREAAAQAAGQIARGRDLYVSGETLARYVSAQERNAATLQAVEIESEDGAVCSLWAAVQASTANRAIRRGELMTRIRGCEEWATERDLVGIFATLTTPSRFHPMRFAGGANPAWDGSTPRDGQRWLCRQWARSRAALARAGVTVFGFRVAEPHHDATPHWHAIMWAPAGQVLALQAVLRAYWLAEDGDEPGAAEHRATFEVMDPARGGAVSYVAKYIAKNIDDEGAVAVEGHRDDGGEGEQVEIEAADPAAARKARRVAAWASTWGIRQFQAVGQPPVTVWREARRVECDAAGKAAPRRIAAVLEAVNRTGERRACWRSYLLAQGGAARRAADYPVRLAVEVEAVEGTYETVERPVPRGIYDTATPGEWFLSNRRAWKPRGTWATADRIERIDGGRFALRAAVYGLEDTHAARFEALRVEALRGADVEASAAALAGFARRERRAPWTRDNNCTQGAGAGRAPLAWIERNEGPGGTEDEPTWTRTPPTPPPAPPIWPPTLPTWAALTT